MIFLQHILVLAQLQTLYKKKIMKNRIIPAIWYDQNGLEALEFYSSIFPNSDVYKSNPMVSQASIMGLDLISINGGPMFKPNPSISFMAVFEHKEELQLTWDHMKSEAKILMPLDKYPFSAYYGWMEDRYQVSWQFYLGELADVNGQAIVPTLMFSQAQQGKCQEAINFYQALFKDFELQGILKYADGECQGQIQHAQFKLNGTTLAAMDSGVPQNFSFNEGVSLTITCKNQEEIDYYWNSICKEGKESQCGWCQDSFGVFWQIVPEGLDIILANHPNAGQNLMRMKKIKIAELMH